MEARAGHWSLPITLSHSFGKGFLIKLEAHHFDQGNWLGSSWDSLVSGHGAGAVVSGALGSGPPAGRASALLP